MSELGDHSHQTGRPITNLGSGYTINDIRINHFRFYSIGPIDDWNSDYKHLCEIPPNSRMVQLDIPLSRISNKLNEFVHTSTSSIPSSSGDGFYSPDRDLELHEVSSLYTTNPNTLPQVQITMKPYQYRNIQVLSRNDDDKDLPAGIWKADTVLPFSPFEGLARPALQTAERDFHTTTFANTSLLGIDNVGGGGGGWSEMNHESNTQAFIPFHDASDRTIYMRLSSVDQDNKLTNLFDQPDSPGATPRTQVLIRSDQAEYYDASLPTHSKIIRMKCSIIIPPDASMIITYIHDGLPDPEQHPFDVLPPSRYREFMARALDSPPETARTGDETGDDIAYAVPAVDYWRRHDDDGASTLGGDQESRNSTREWDEEKLHDQ
ncbi:uncharacterized protein I303_105573 [Kwoniella dejecticola CBS 10117]|uniref:Uncharacterized protein n=1 Tax=Kwoniella dejecticola CBS 10117 TaxID=1296121 RepID=A0A1A6A237_9TREE|nr:uncharacterized protein I303_04984 [Kwoniella dejecticola CBS 10117]OBR84127.1 hypothetical protein I303_04984 [Kwoniella dejecticola CBS 10117]